MPFKSHTSLVSSIFYLSSFFFSFPFVSNGVSYPLGFYEQTLAHQTHIISDYRYNLVIFLHLTLQKDEKFKYLHLKLKIINKKKTSYYNLEDRIIFVNNNMS